MKRNELQIRKYKSTVFFVCLFTKKQPELKVPKMGIWVELSSRYLSLDNDVR